MAKRPHRKEKRHRARPPTAATAAPDRPILTTGLAAGMFFGLALVFFLPALLPGRGIYGSDYLAGGYPFFQFMAERFRALDLPGWVPHVYGGVPLFASPGSGFYPIWLLLALILPVAAVLPLLFAIQMGLGGLGMFLLVRELGARRWVAFLTGLAFQFTGTITAYVYAGHDGRMIVATLAPLFLFFLHRLVRKGGLAPAAGAAATLAFALLSFQIQSTYYLLLAGLAWGIFALVSFRLRGRTLATRTGLALGAVALAFLLSAVNFLPFLDYVDASPRGGEEGRGWEFATSWAMPPSDLTALAIPELQGASVLDPESGEAQFPDYRGPNPFKLHTEYAGALVLLLAGLGLWFNRRNRYAWFFLGLAVFMLSIALGGHTPIYRLYYELLPGTRRFRAPSIAFYVVIVALVVMAGLMLERLARLRDAAAREDREELGRIRVALLGAIGLGVLILLLGATADDPGRVAGAARFAVFFIATAGILWAWLSDRLAVRGLVVVLGLVTLADLWIIGRRFMHTVQPPAVWFQADDVVHAIQQRGPGDRVWVLPVGPQYRTGNFLMVHGLDQAGGEHPNPLRRWYEYVGEGVGHYVDWHNFLGDSPHFLDAANIRWIVSMVRIEGAPQFAHVRLVHPGPTALVYENPRALPRAYLAGSARVVDDPAGALTVLADPAFDPRTEVVLHEPPPIPPAGGPVEGAARVTARTPDEVRVAVQTDRAALLVLADNYYPGWEARLNGDATPILRANHTFRAVAVPAGEHEVVFRFRPPELAIGFWIYLLGLLALAGYGAWLAAARLRSPPEHAG